MTFSESAFGTPRRHVASCESTNDLARAWAADPQAPAPHGALVSADFQTRGRGRRGHRWDAGPAQSALLSFVLRPQIPLADAWQLGLLTALAAADALRGLGLDARLKWPNDVLLNGAKAGGVLVEVVPGPPALGAGGAAIAGIGLNVNQGQFDGDAYAFPPTSLRLASGHAWPVGEVTGAAAAALGHWDGVFREQGFGPIHAACRQRLAVGAALRRGGERGVLTDLTPAGHACVRFADGTFAEWTALEG